MLEGDAMLRTRGGEVKTCAGLPVSLVPASDYTMEWISRRYGAPGGGLWQRATAPWTPAVDGGLQAFIRRGLCNAQGQFRFKDLPDGVYYVIATVTWDVVSASRYGAYTEEQGGEMAQMVEVGGGETKTITVTR